ncbi:hypothetical protein ACROYT_G002795 [Oculina patagonica]
MNYCPETVLVHSAFLLAHNEAVRGLNELVKGECSKALQVVSGAIREITQGALVDEKHELLQVEIRELEFKIHSWVFYSLFRSYGGFGFSESAEEEYFDSFPPLPKIGVRFYVELVQEVEWSDLLVECLYALGVENITSLLEDVIKSLTQDPNFKDLSLFLCLFKSLLMTGIHHLASDNQDDILCDPSGSKSCSLLLLEGVASLTKDFISWPEAQLDIIKNVVDFTVIDVVDLNFRKQCTKEDWKINSGHWWLQNSDSCKHCLYSVKEGELVERTSCVNSEHRENAEVPEQQKRMSDLVIFAECAACIDFLCQVIIDDWRQTSHWTANDSSNSSVGEVDSSSWHPLHKWFTKLYAFACLLVSNSTDNKLQEQASRLQHGLSQYVEKHATEREHMWIEGFKKGELTDFEESCLKEEFSSPVGSVDLLLFQPETSEEQFHFYLQRVNGRLEGYKECFDWLLSAEEFHGASDWLECMKNHAVEISDIQHALKMIDIIYMQRQCLCSDDKPSDAVYRDIKEILLTLHSSLPCSAQEKIIEYAFFMSRTLESPGNDSILFHPWFMEEERATFQQQLVMTFNKLSSEDQLQSSVTDLTTALLISAPLTLNKALQEGVKSAGHTKTICSVLQKFPALCQLRYDESDSSKTLLCQALILVTVGVSSRQQENNLLNLVAVMLTTSPTQLLSVQEFTEAIVLPFLNNNNMQGDIPTVLALKLHNTLMESVMTSISVQLPFLKKHVLPIIHCLCELLNECNVFWDGMAPVHSLSEMEELRELVLKALDSEIKMCLEVLKTNPTLAMGVEWLFKRMKGGFDWTIPLHLEHLFSAADIRYKLSIPGCLLSVCEESGGKWMADKGLIYGTEDVFTVLFEYCRVSDSTLKWILESLIPNKLISGFQDIRSSVVTSLAQILPHCIWKEWKRVLEMCRHLVKQSILQAGSTESVPCLQTQDGSQDVYQLSALLLDTLEVFHSPLCAAWATPHVWVYVIRHYITAIKEIVDEMTDAAATALVFAHVCHVMTFVPVDCIDQLFVLALDLVSRPSVSNSDVSEQLKHSINSLSSEVHRAALAQKLNQSL